MRQRADDEDDVCGLDDDTIPLGLFAPPSDFLPSYVYVYCSTCLLGSIVWSISVARRFKRRRVRVFNLNIAIFE